MKTIVTSGKRKTAIARATLKEGKGVVRINKIPIDIFQPLGYKLRIQEPLMLAQDVVKKVNINVKVIGGGPMSQSDAVRLAIARALSEYEPKLKNIFLEYDRQLLVADVRLKEQHKPNRHGRARAKKQKSYR
ncbi:MAG: 30S ribosomal protein S9 [Candidatus Woesearchaeota archaeon]